MARQYAAEEDGWALAKRGDAAKAIKVRETGDGVPLGTIRDLATPYQPVTAAKTAFRAWLGRFRQANRGANPPVSDILADNLMRLEREGHTTRTTATRYARLKRFFAVGVKDVSHELCESYARTQEAEGYSPHTIWGDLNCLRSALKSAFERKKIDHPCHVYCWNIAKPPGRKVVITPDEFWRWYDHATSAHIRLFLVIALMTSARHEAICQLKWDHVDFETGVIDFTASMRNKRGVADKGYQKARAKVVMTATLRGFLLAARAVARSSHVIEYQGLSVKNCESGCTSARIAAGLPAGVTPHILRHTAATWAVESGIDVDRVAEMTGHADRRTLETIYVHRTGKGSQAAVEAVETKLGGRLRVVK